jgi:hypothetical protein
MTASLNIGLTAYHVVGNLAFVKVPSERGRYMLTDLCVTVVPCPTCNAVVGEPCRRYYGLRYWDRHFPEEKPLAHGVAVHVPRKLAAAKKYGRGYARRLATQFKVRLAAEDVVAAMADAPDPNDPPAADDIDVPVIRRKEG